MTDTKQAVRELRESQLTVQCQRCNGSGEGDMNGHIQEHCHDCDGTGSVLVADQLSALRACAAELEAQLEEAMKREEALVRDLKKAISERDTAIRERDKARADLAEVAGENVHGRPVHYWYGRCEHLESELRAISSAMTRHLSRWAKPEGSAGE